jgi:ribonuclease J
MGAKEADTLALKNGDIVEFSNQTARKSGHIHVKSVLIDGLGIGDVGNTVLRDRHILSKEGIVIALVHFDRDEKVIMDAPELLSRGFVFEQKYGKILDDASRDLVAEFQRRKVRDVNVIRNTAIDFLEKYFFEKTHRRPMILPVVVEV